MPVLGNLEGGEVVRHAEHRGLLRVTGSLAALRQISCRLPIGAGRSNVKSSASSVWPTL